MLVTASHLGRAGSRLGRAGLETVPQHVGCNAARMSQPAKQQNKIGAKERKKKKAIQQHADRKQRQRVRSSLFPQSYLALCRGCRSVNTSCLHLPPGWRDGGERAAEEPAEVQGEPALPWRHCPSTTGASAVRPGRSCFWRRALTAATCCGTVRASRGSTASACCECGWTGSGRGAGDTADPNLGILGVAWSHVVSQNSVWTWKGGWGAMKGWEARLCACYLLLLQCAHGCTHSIASITTYRGEQRKAFCHTECAFALGSSWSGWVSREPLGLEWTTFKVRKIRSGNISSYRVKGKIFNGMVCQSGDREVCSRELGSVKS